MSETPNRSADFEKALCKFLADWGYLDAKKLRDDQVRVEFYNLRRAGTKVEKALEILAERFFVSTDTVNSIIYRKASQ